MKTANTSAIKSHWYGRVWRWHFFAAMIVIPFILWQSFSGVAYLWHRELASAAHPEMLYVTPGDTKVDYEQQLQSALSHHQGQRLTQIQLFSEPDRATTFMFSADNGLAYPAFVNPYTGQYLGSVEPAWWLPGVSRALHGGWPLGNTGSYLLELGACWTIVMIISGLYLWWPRQTKSLAGVLYPRLGQGTRRFWRDAHSVAGVYFSLIVLTFLLTALPWTSFWGTNVLGPIKTAFEQTSPADRFFMHAGGHVAHGGGSEASHQHHAQQVLTLDEVVAMARKQGLNGGLDINWQPQVAAMQSHANRSPEKLFLRVNRESGEILERADWADFPGLARVIALGVDLHEGRYFGLINQLFNTLVAASLVWLSVSGFMGWYRRRPNRGVSPPPKRPVKMSVSFIALVVGLSLLLPLLGISLLFIIIMDKVLGRFLTKLATS